MGRLHRRCELWQLLSIFTNYIVFTQSVKMFESMNMPDRQIERLLDLIQRTGLIFDITEEVRVARGRKVDCVVTSADGSLSIAVERKIELNAGNVWGVVHLAEAVDLPLVLVADRSTEAARSVLREHGVGYLDAIGNANVALPGIYVQTDSSHKAPIARTTPTTRLRGKAGLVVQALLIEPDLDGACRFLPNRLVCRLVLPTMSLPASSVKVLLYRREEGLSESAELLRRVHCLICGLRRTTTERTARRHSYWRARQINSPSEQRSCSAEPASDTP